MLAICIILVVVQVFVCFATLTMVSHLGDAGRRLREIANLLDRPPNPPPAVPNIEARTAARYRPARVSGIQFTSRSEDE